MVAIHRLECGALGRPNRVERRAHRRKARAEARRRLRKASVIRDEERLLASLADARLRSAAFRDRIAGGVRTSSRSNEVVMRDVISWSFPIGQLFGITIRIHLILPLVAIGLIGREAVRKEAVAGAWEDAAMLMALMFLAVLLHELGPCFAARYMDGAAGPGLLLTFVFDIMPPFNPVWYPYRNDGTSIAMNLTTWGGKVVPVDNLFAIVLARFFWANWILALFNLVLVGYPFDSGRMLQAALWPRLGHFQATKVAIYAGFVVMLVIGLVSIVWSEPLLILLAIFIFASCAQELMNLEHAQEESLFGYDFSQGYTSLEKDEPPPPALPKRKKRNFIQRWLAERAAKKRLGE